MKRTIQILPLLIAVLCFSACKKDNAMGDAGTDPSTQPVKVIFDTDLGNSTDDALAMQALFYLQQQKKCQIIGMMTSLQLDKGRELADRWLHYYKADQVPLGVLPGYEEIYEMVPYYQLVDLCKEDDTPFYPSTGIPIEERLPAWKLYRKLLSEAEDGSVTIICVGKYSNLGQLLVSGPDEYSSLTGQELVKRKVNRLEATGGCFTPVPLRMPSGEDKQEFLTVEYNVAGDIPLAKRVLEEWPSELRLFPLEEGMKYPSNHDEVLADYAWQPDNPLYQIYSRYDEWAIGDLGQYWWDALVVFHAIMGEEYFCCTRPGQLNISDEGCTTFDASEGGRAHIISTNAEYSGFVYNWLRSLSLFKP